MDLNKEKGEMLNLERVLAADKGLLEQGVQRSENIKETSYASLSVNAMPKSYDEAIEDWNKWEKVIKDELKSLDESMRYSKQTG